MRVLTTLAAVSALAATVVLTGTGAAVAASSSPAASSSAAASSSVAAGASAGGGCHVVLELVNGKWTAITVCSSGSGGNGKQGSGGGSGGGGTNGICTLTSLPAHAVVPYPPPKGDQWMWEVCVWHVNGVTVPGTAGMALVRKGATTAKPGITPQDLLAQAESELQVPQLAAATAPPRRRDGLVGLPEWFWVPARAWHPVTSTVSVGPVWATVTAAPGQITYSPGAGLPEVSCHGPGTPYNPKLPASAQHTACSYTYSQPSAGQPGNAYQASLTVTWNITWTGSGGAGGNVGTVQESFPFAVPIAQGEALVTSP